MTLQEDFDALSAEFHALKVEWETAKQNLLSTALITPGTLRFGGNIMELDHDGMQVKGATAVPPQTAIYFVKQLTPTPSASYPRGQLDGYAIPSPAAGLTEIQALASSTYFAKVYAYTGTATNPESAFYVTDGSNTSTAILSVSSSAVNGRFTLDNATLRLASFGADPTTLADGDIWYRSDTDVIRARINGATVTIAPISASILTDTAWANKGDIVVATANDTAQIVSVGQDGYVLKADSTQTPGVKWKGMLEVSNQTGTYNAVQGEYVRCSGTFTVTLPNASANDYIVVGNVGTGVITINTTGGATFDYYSTGMASGTITILPGERLQFLFYTTGSWQVF